MSGTRRADPLDGSTSRSVDQVDASPVQVLRDELEEVLDENVRLNAEVVALRSRLAPRDRLVTAIDLDRARRGIKP